MLLELVILLALHADDKNEAEQLFRKMETKLTNAKSLECTFEAKVDGGKAPGTLKGSLAMAEVNKSRLDLNAKFAGEEEGKSIAICDGEILGLAGNREQRGPAPEWHNDAYRAVLTRSGVIVSLVFRFSRGFLGEQPKEFKADDKLKVSGFKLGKKENVGEQEAQAVQYNLQRKAVPGPLAVTLWIDTKTNLPIKRELVAKEGDAKITITETYSKWSIDEKIDPKKFELPKD